MKVVRHFVELRKVWEPRNASNYWNDDLLTLLWGGVIQDVMPSLLIETKMCNDSPFLITRAKVLLWHG